MDAKRISISGIARILFWGAVAGALWSCGAAPSPAPPVVPEGMVWIEGAADQPGFLMDATELTVAEFSAFVEATGYVTEADDFGWSGVFNYDSLAWLPIDSANWEFPQGPAAAPARPDHPVTQLSMRDVLAYAKWADKRLPTEVEWLWAASQSGQHPDYPWGKEMIPDQSKFPGNWWQGPFPFEDAVLDGFPGIAPVRSFPPAMNGLYDISGNVWEWTSSFDQRTQQYIIKGGSFLCSTSYCTGFNLNTDQYTPADSGLNHLGVRFVK